jgi:hypothetical protein
MLGWINNWNTIIRDVIWRDYDLKRLMKIPPKTGILQFCDRYFVRAGFTNKLLTDEVCRIIYAETEGHDTDVPNVKKNVLTFDIYVKQDELHNIGDDRLLSRADLIAERIYRLLTSERYLDETGYRFWIAPGGQDLGTRTVGYVRKNIAFYFMKVY